MRTVLTVLLAVAACQPLDETGREATPTDGPRLVVVVVTDQTPAEFVERFRPVLSHGLARLLDQGVLFTRAEHDHAETLTCTGHATLVTGVHPSRSGMIANYWYDRGVGEETYCVDDPDYRRSPERILTTSLPDWIAAGDPEARIFSVGGKDRSAIMLGGKAAERAFWYDQRSGGWTTSGWYTRGSPGWSRRDDPIAEWVDRFNDLGRVDAWFGTLWEPLPVDEELLEQMEIIDVDEGVYDRGFPHALGRPEIHPDGSFYGAVYSSPFLDRTTLEFTKRLIEEERLGADARTDYLGVSFSALDTVGHDYGPNSREVLDTLMRLDRTLGELLDFLDERVGLDRTVLAWSSDHGVVPLPEIRHLRGLEGARLGDAEVACFQRVWRAMIDRWGPGEWVEYGGYLDHEALEKAGIDLGEARRFVARSLEACDSVRRVWSHDELLGDADGRSESREEETFRRLHANSFHPGRSPDVIVQFEPFLLTDRDPGETTHGSVYGYDRRVPLVVLAPDVAARRVDEPVRTVDLAPTLARLAGIPIPDGLDGRDLTPLIRDPDDDR